MKYERQELLYGKEAQEKLAKAHVAIIGVGALGSVVADLLCRAGIGTLTLIDRDIVEEHNLQRQSLYTEKDVGKPKVVAAEQHLMQINSSVKINTHFTDVHYKNIHPLLSDADLIIDGLDNLHTRFVLNDYCQQEKQPWIYGAAIKEEGYAMFIKEHPCLTCFLEEAQLDTCAQVGVSSAITHMVASVQAHLCLQYFVDTLAVGKLHHLTLAPAIETITVQRKKDCNACNKQFDYLHGKGEDVTRLCGSDLYQIKGIAYKEARQKVEGQEESYGMHLPQGLLTKDGRFLVKAESLEEAKKIWSEVIGH